MKGTHGLKKRDCYLEFDELEPGEYYMYCEVDWLQATQETAFVATCYGVNTVTFKDASHEHAKGDLLSMATYSIVA